MNKHTGVELLEQTLNTRLLENLKTLANVNEEDIEILDNGFRFTFERSLKTNFCRVVRYHDKVIVEFRKRTNNLIEGKYDRLVYESVINPSEFSDVFQNVTGIYLDYV